MASIVLIDNDVVFGDEMRETLERGGHAVQLAEDGNRGMELIEQSPPDLVVTELIMPEREGIETIVELGERFPAVSIMAISGTGPLEAEGPLLDATMLGAVSTLSKPFTMEEFLREIEEILVGS